MFIEKYEFTPTKFSTRKSLALKNFGSEFTSDPAVEKDNELEIQGLYVQIGQLKIENYIQKNCDDQF